jgi:uncharacterized delta-60 repeat protein
MRFQKILFAAVQLIVSLCLLLPTAALAHIISITATSPFPSQVNTLSTTTANFTVTNISSQTPLTVVDQSQFPSGLSISNSTCGSLMNPGQSCVITLQLQATSAAQTISTELRERASPSADGVKFPIVVSVVATPRPTRYTVTPIATANGVISPNSPQVVSSGSSQVFTATPASGYGVNQWLVDGVLAQTGGTSFTLANITANHAVQVAFTPVSPFVANGSVNAIVPDLVTGKTYIAGDFTVVGPRTGAGVPLDSSGSILGRFPEVAGNISVVMPDGVGGWFIGGSFAYVGGIARNNIAHILANYTVDANFNPGPGLNNSINALAIDGATSKLYVGGGFTNFNGTGRNWIVRLNTDGTLDTGFTPTGSGFDNGINALVVDSASSKLYAAGGFTSFNGISRNRIARLNSDGTLDTNFNPGTGFDNLVLSLAFDNATNKLYAAGFFNHFNGTGRNYIARLNNNGTLDAGFVPGAGFNAFVFSLALDNATSKIYAGGFFTSYNGTGRNYIARLNTNGTLDAGFNPGSGFDSGVFTIVVDSITSKLYAGGVFTGFNGTSRNRIARLNSDGTLDTVFAPGSGFDNGVFGLAIDNVSRVLYAGGTFASFNGVARNRIARFNSDGTVDAGFDPGTGFDATVYTLLYDRATSKLYAGGDFATFNATARNRVARLNHNGTLDTGFNPLSGFDSTVRSLALDGVINKLYTGGDFASFNGVGRNRIARLNLDGTLDNTFNPGTGFDATVYSLVLDVAASKIYAGGDYTSFNGAGRNRIARISSDGALDTSFNPGTGFDGIVRTLTLDGQANKLYTGGDFTSFNGMGRNGIARLSSDGSLDAGFNPGTGFNASVNALALDSANSRLYVGGSFTSFNAIPRNRIARLGINGMLDTSFNPNANSDVFALALSDFTLYAGGSFSYVGVLATAFYSVIPA